MLLSAAESGFYDVTGDPDTTSLFLKQIVADGQYILSFSECDQSCGEHGSCQSTYPNDPNVNNVSCDIGCAGSEYRCDNSPKGACKCSDGYSGDRCQIPPASAAAAAAQMSLTRMPDNTGESRGDKKSGGLSPGRDSWNRWGGGCLDHGGGYYRVRDTTRKPDLKRYRSLYKSST